MKKKVTVIDYGAGNILSLQRALEYLSVNVDVTSDPKKIEKSSYLILPGDGAFAFAVKNLKKKRIFNLLINHVNKQKPLFGICLGMQLLMTESNEFGKTHGLDIIKGKISKIVEKNDNIKVPAIGWSELSINQKSSSQYLEIIKNFNKKKFYFVHSYKAETYYKNDLLAYYYHGKNKVSSIIGRENVIGTQFHPEKSGKNGLEMIKRFIKI